MQRTPRFRYPLTALGAFAKPITVILGFTVEMWAQSSLAALPWGWVSVCFLAFFAGQLVADTSNPASWIRVHVSQFGRVFAVEKVWPRHSTDQLELTVKVRALQKTQSADLQLSVYRVAIHGRLIHDFTESLSKSADFMAAEERSFVLAQIPTAYHKNGVWAGGRPVLELGRYMVELRFSAKFYQRQSHRIYLEMLQPDSKTCARFFYIDEEDDPLALTEL